MLNKKLLPTQNLVTIVPENRPLLVEATLSNQDISYVRVGQKVDVKVDTYPFLKYGALKGRLVWISPVAENLANPNAKNPAGMSLSEKLENDKSAVGNTSYRVHIKLDPKSRLVQYPNQATTLKWV